MHILFVSGKSGGLSAMRQTIEGSQRLQWSIALVDQHLQRPAVGIDWVEPYVCDVLSPSEEIMRTDSSLARMVQVSSVTTQTAGLIADLEPDALMVYGDRPESLAAALAATVHELPIIHVQGGDITGRVDNRIRAALTKLSHIHLVATQWHAMNLAKLGETQHIYEVGDHHLDELEKVSTKFAQNPQWDIVFHLHPDDGVDHEAAIAAVQALDLPTLWIYPCNDPGYQEILDCLPPSAVPSLPRIDYLSAVAGSRCLIGNSSAGLIEAPQLGTWTLNLGSRQRGRPRERSVIDTTPGELVHQIEAARSAPCPPPKNLYGKPGTAWRKTLEILENLDLNKVEMIK